MSEETHTSGRPCIGIPYMDSLGPRKKLGKYFLWQIYVQAIESVGGEPILIRVNQPETYYKDLFKKINGLFIPGGTANSYSSPVRTAMQYMFDLAVEANDKGDYFPIWGTCLGIQLLAALVTPGEKVLGKFFLKNETPPLDFSDDFRESKLFRNAPEYIIELLRDHNTTSNFHKKGVSYEAYKSSKAFQDFFRVLSTNVAQDGQVFVSTMEARNYPFYAVQWHPEKSVYDKMAMRNVDRTEQGMAISYYLHDFFVDEARKSNHQFDSAEEEFDNGLYKHCTKLKLFEREQGKDVMYFFEEDDF